MASTFSMLKRVAANATAAVSEAVQKMGSTSAGDDQLNGYKQRLTDLDREMNNLKDRCSIYSRSVMNLASSAGEVANEFRSVYKASAPRQTQVAMFANAQTKLDEAAFRAYSIDSYGVQVLGVLDDWLVDSTRVSEEIRNAEAALEEVNKLQERVAAARASKERRGQRGESNPKEDQVLNQAEEMLVKYEKNFTTQRAELDKKVNRFIDGRYSVLDSIFVRFMELQSEFAAAFVQAASPFQATSSVYRKRFPLNSAMSPRSPTSQNGFPSPTSSPAPDMFAGATVRSSTPPNDMNMNGAAPAAAPQRKPPTQSVSSISHDDNDSDSDDDSDSDEDDSSDEESDDDEPVKPAAKPASVVSPRTSTQNSAPAPDLLDFGSQKAKAEPDLFDLFGGSGNAAPTQSRSSPSPPPAAAKTSDNPLDMFDVGFSGGAPAAAAPVKKSAPSFDPFDPMSASEPSKPKVVAAAPAPIKRDPSLNIVAKGGVSTEGLDDHIEKQQEERLRELREADDKADSEAAAKKDATYALEDRLNAWANKDGQRKPIRALLSSLHTVLWPGTSWKQVGLADLIDLVAIKKAHRKAILIVHPDKVQDGTPEQKVIAEHCFDALNSAFDRFQETGQ